MHVVFMAVLFAVVGALCGILVTKTYSGANFVPSSGCSVVGSSVIPNSSLLTDEFVDASFFAAQWATVNTDVNHTLTLETGNSRVYMLILSAVADACKNVGFRSAQFTGNFDVWMDAETLTYANYISPGIIFYVDDDNFIGFGMKTSNNGAADYPAFHWKIGGVSGYIQQGTGGRARRQLRVRRVGTTYTASYRNTSGDSWTDILVKDLAIGLTGKIMLGTVPDGALASCYHDFCIYSMAFTVGGPSVSASCVFTVCDNAAQTINAGSLQAFDRATFGVTTTNSPTLSFRTSDQDADGAPSWSASKTLGQLQAEANSGKQFMAIEVTASNNGASYQFDQLSVDTYNLDVTPPGVPAIDWVASLKEGVGFAVDVTEPEDADLSHCEFEIKVNGGSWQKVDSSLGLGGSNYMKFKNQTTDPQPAGWINRSDFARWGYQIGDVIAVRCRAVDLSGNSSAWVTSDPIVLADQVYVPIFVDGYTVQWIDDTFVVEWTELGNPHRRNGMIQLTNGTTWAPQAKILNVPADAGAPEDYTVRWALKKYADDASCVVGPIDGTIVLDTDGSWLVRAVIDPSDQPQSPQVNPGQYLMYFELTNGISGSVKELPAEQVEILPKGVVS